MKKKHLLTAFMIVNGMNAWSQTHDFKFDDLYYKITSDTTVAVAAQYGGGSRTNYWNLTIANIPEKVSYNDTEYAVTKIDDDAFWLCKSLTSVNIPYSITSIGKFAFLNCSELSSVAIPNSVTSIGYDAFKGCSKLTSVNIHSSVTNIGNGTFQNCSNLTTITIPNSITCIGSSMFQGCVNMTSIIIPDCITTISTSAFQGCSKLTSITIPDSVKIIDDRAFYNCSNLKWIIIANSVETISRDAFEKCDQLVSVSCLSTNPPTIKKGSPLYDSDPFPMLDTIYVPSESVEVYKATDPWLRKTILPYNTISAKSSNNSFGTIKGDSILFGTKTATITAIPYDSYHFVSWNDGNKENPRVFSEAKDFTVTAIFEAHTVVIDSAITATCTATGLTEGSHCSGCNTVIVAQSVIPMLAHTIVIDTAITATCTATGLTEGSHCSVCNTVLVVQTEIPLVAHTIVTDPAVTATANETGLTEGSHCSVCGTVIVAQEIVPALGEQGGNTNPGTAVAETVADVINIYAVGNTIFLENAKSEIRVYDDMGRLVATSNSEDAEIRISTAGVYLVKVEGTTKRVMVND